MCPSGRHIYPRTAVKRYEHENNIHGMMWQTQFPDINIIDNCWLRVFSTLQNRAREITYRSHLFEAILDILLTSIPRHIMGFIISICQLSKRDNSYLTAAILGNILNTMLQLVLAMIWVWIYSKNNCSSLTNSLSSTFLTLMIKSKINYKIQSSFICL